MKIAIVAMLSLTLFAQVDGTSEHRYLVPLPGTKNIAISDWEYTLEFMSLDGVAYEATIEQYDIRGRMLDQTHFGLRNGAEVFRWNITENAVNGRLRSVVIVSDKPLVGTLIMHNEEFGQINSMRLAEKLSDTLVMPFIPQSYFEMTTSFALQGFSQLDQTSEVSFFLVDADEKEREPLTLRSNLASFGYIIGTPELTLSLGGLDGEVVPSWANIQPLSPDFVMSGFQTFTREDGSKAFLFQSAGAELEEKGYPSGHVLFSPEGEIPLRHEIVVTNPGLTEITVNLELFFESYEPLIEDTMLVSESAVVSLRPFERRRFFLGEDVFANVTDPLVRLAYEARTVGEETSPAEIFALHFQMGPQGEMSGASFTQAGNEIRTWLTRSDQTSTDLELVNVGRQRLVYPDVEVIDGVEVPSGTPTLESEDTVFTVKFITEDGRINQTPLNYRAGNPFIAPSLDKVSRIFGDEQLESVQIIFTVESGQPLISKVTRHAGNDFAVTNPLTRTIVTEEK